MGRERGWGLLEMLLGVTAGGMLVAFALTLYMSSARKQAIDEAQRDIGKLVENLESGVGRIQSYHGLTAENTVGRGLVPLELLDGNTPRTRWGSLELGSAGPLHDGLRIELAGIPADVCAELVPALAPLATEIRVGQQVVGRHYEVVVENIGACEEGGPLVLERFVLGVGMKAVWETW